MEEELGTQGARDQRIAARRARISKQRQALDGSPEALAGSAASREAAGELHLAQHLEQSRQAHLAARELAEQEAAAVRLAGVRREDERRTQIEGRRQELGNRFEAESRGSADGLAAITARWPLLLDMEVPQELQAALQAQQAECELVLSRKGAIIEAARNILRAQDDEFVATLSAQAEDVDTLLACVTSQTQAMEQNCVTELARVMAALLQARQSAASAAAADLEAALEARGASEQAYVDQVLAKAEEARGLLREQRGVDAEEYKALKSRLEEQLHALEADYGILRATYQANTEKLVYNCRVLAERAQESAATLSQQKRRLSRQRDVLSGIKQRYAHAERKCAEDNLRTTEDYRRTLQAFAGLQDKFRRFQDADTAKRTAVLSMKTAELGLLEEQLLEALRTVHEQQLGWAWSAAPEHRWDALKEVVDEQVYETWRALEQLLQRLQRLTQQRLKAQGQVVCEQLVHRELCLLLGTCERR